MDNFNDLHYNSISTYLKNSFGQRIVKLSLDAGLTCPNRDGSKGHGGCSFCLGGSGEFTASIEQQMLAARTKWNEPVKFIVYFQSYTNTYASAEYLRMLREDALNHEDVVGIAIATRPDCIDGEVLNVLSDLNQKTFLWVELGLQTANEKTAEAFNRCYPNASFHNAITVLQSCGIKTVVHMILGLPGESHDDFINTAKYVAKHKPFGIKIHMLHIMEGTKMGDDYKVNPWPILTKEEYVSDVVEVLELIPKDVTVHRLTGDAPKDVLIAPNWTEHKHDILNAIQHEFSIKNTYQGKKTE